MIKQVRIFICTLLLLLVAGSANAAIDEWTYHGDKDEKTTLTGNEIVGLEDTDNSYIVKWTTVQDIADMAVVTGLDADSDLKSDLAEGLEADTDTDMTVKLGDNAGSYCMEITDSDDTVIWQICSDGVQSGTAPDGEIRVEFPNNTSRSPDSGKNEIYAEDDTLTAAEAGVEKDIHLEGDVINISTGTTPPATCSVGDMFIDTDEDTNGSLLICIATNTWKEVDDDGLAGSGDDVSVDSVSVTDPDLVSTGDIDVVDTSNTITFNLNADVVDEAHIADDGIDSEHYNDGSIDAVHLVADVVDETKIADDGIDSEHYNDDSVDDAHVNWGTGGSQVSGSDVPLDVTNFDNQLSGTDSDVQTAFETLDELAGSGDDISIDSVAVVNPDLVSTGDIDVVDTSNTVTFNINNDVVDSEHYVDGSVDPVHLAVQYEYELIPINWFVDGTSAPAELDDASTRSPWRYRSFAGTTGDEDVSGIWQIPDDADTTTGVWFRVHYIIPTSSAPSSNGIVFALQGASVGDNDATNPTLGTAVTIADTSVTASQWDLLITGWSGAVTITNAAAGEMAELGFYRDQDHASDTYGQDVGVAFVEIRYTRDPE